MSRRTSSWSPGAICGSCASPPASCRGCGRSPATARITCCARGFAPGVSRRAPAGADGVDLGRTTRDRVCRAPGVRGPRRGGTADAAGRGDRGAARRSARSGHAVLPRRAVGAPGRRSPGTPRGRRQAAALAGAAASARVAARRGRRDAARHRAGRGVHRRGHGAYRGGAVDGGRGRDRRVDVRRPRHQPAGQDRDGAGWRRRGHRRRRRRCPLRHEPSPPSGARRAANAPRSSASPG